MALGAQRAVLMTFHGAPLHSLALDAGVRWLRAQGVPAIAPLNLTIAQMLTMQEADLPTLEPAVAPIEDPQVRQAVLQELPTDFHAGFFETSLLMHFEPKAVSSRLGELPPCPAIKPSRAVLGLSRMAGALGAKALRKELEFAAIGLGWQSLRPFVGYTGRPALANPASGAAFAKMLLDRYAEAAQATLLEGAPPPKPALRWLLPLSLGGRLPQPTIPDRHIPPLLG